MGNQTSGLKKLLTNKNTVTVIGVVAAILVLYVGYNIRVKKAINPITVPYAKETIKAGEQITEDKVGTIQVPPSMLKGGVFTKQGDVIDKYSRSDSIIPEGSLFYDTVVVEKEQLPDNIIYDVPAGYTLYYMSVNTTTTYGNSIYPENYIDIYLKAETKLEDGTQATNNQVMIGKLIENVKVLAVKDSAGQPVFANLDDQKTPSMLIFAVPNEYYALLKKAEFLRTYDTTLIPVPTNESLKDDPGKVAITSEKLKSWINEVTIWDPTNE